MGDFSIQISSNLINRLTEDEDKLNRRTKKTKAKVSRENQKSQSKKDQKQIPAEYQKEEGNAGARWPVQPPFLLPVTPPTHSVQMELDAIRSTVQESEKIVEKLRKQEENIVQEVTQKAKDLRDKEFKIPDPKPMLCSAENDAWKTCYKENANDLMRCAHLAKNFADCARRVRQLVSSADK